jgi:hypothetical protein
MLGGQHPPQPSIKSELEALLHVKDESQTSSISIRLPPADRAVGFFSVVAVLGWRLLVSEPYWEDCAGT